MVQLVGVSLLTVFSGNRISVVLVVTSPLSFFILCGSSLMLDESG